MSSRFQRSITNDKFSHHKSLIEIESPTGQLIETSSHHYNNMDFFMQDKNLGKHRTRTNILNRVKPNHTLDVNITPWGMNPSR